MPVGPGAILAVLALAGVALRLARGNVPRGFAPVTLGRFAFQPTVPLGDLAPGAPAQLSIPGDEATTPWRVSVGGAAPVCVRLVERD